MHLTEFYKSFGVVNRSHKIMWTLINTNIQQNFMWEDIVNDEILVHNITIEPDEHWQKIFATDFVDCELYL